MMKYIIIISIELPEEGGLRRRMMWLQWFGRMSERRVERARAPRSECIKYHRRCVCSDYLAGQLLLRAGRVLGC